MLSNQKSVVQVRTIYTFTAIKYSNRGMGMFSVKDLLDILEAKFRRSSTMWNLLIVLNVGALGWIFTNVGSIDNVNKKIITAILALIFFSVFRGVLRTQKEVEIIETDLKAKILEHPDDGNLYAKYVLDRRLTSNRIVTVTIMVAAQAAVLALLWLHPLEGVWPYLPEPLKMLFSR